MSEWGDGIRVGQADVVFDLERDAPEVFAALNQAAPAVAPALARLRTGIPVMASALPGEQGSLYRLRGHNRSVCIALGPEKSTADVIVLKGSEPLLPDFEPYLDWMKGRQFGTWPRPIMEHFPLFEGKAPGTVFLDEAQKEAEVALGVQRAHVRHYGGLMRLPVPLAVLRLPEAKEAEVIAQLQSRMSDMAFDRIEPHLRRGIGIFAYYYPGPPVRVHAIGRPRFLWPAGETLANRTRIIEHSIPAWIQMAARLFWLGFLPSTPLSWRLGTIFDPNNTCLDGGACDVGSIYPMEKSDSEPFFMRSVVMTIGGMRQAVARALGIPMAELAQTHEQEVASFYLGEYIKDAMDVALRTEARDTLTLDPRVPGVFAPGKTLLELLTMFEGFNAYLGTTEYNPLPFAL